MVKTNSFLSQIKFEPKREWMRRVACAHIRPKKDKTAITIRMNLLLQSVEYQASWNCAMHFCLIVISPYAYTCCRSIMIQDLYAPSCWSSIVVVMNTLHWPVNLHIPSYLPIDSFNCRNTQFFPNLFAFDSLFFFLFIFLKRMQNKDRNIEKKIKPNAHIQFTCLLRIDCFLWDRKTKKRR